MEYAQQNTVTIKYCSSELGFGEIAHFYNYFNEWLYIHPI